jgi:hypothetical protein
MKRFLKRQRGAVGVVAGWIVAETRLIRDLPPNFRTRPVSGKLISPRFGLGWLGFLNEE